MRVAFAGTPEFARVALAAIHAAGHEVPLVLTQPDRPAGRGLKLLPSAVKQFALDHGLAVAQARSLRLDGKYLQDAAAARATLEAVAPEVMVVAAYGLILPRWVLERRLRAFDPFPGCGFRLPDGEVAKLWRARVAAGGAEPGTVLDAGERLIVACGDGALELMTLQRSGGRRIGARDFLHGRPLSAG